MDKVLTLPNRRLQAKKIIFDRVLVIALICVYAVRLFSYISITKVIIGPDFPSRYIPSFTPFLTVLCGLAVMLETASTLLVCLRSFFSFKSLRTICRFFTLPCFLLHLALTKYICLMLSGNGEFSLLMLTCLLECVFGAALSVYHFVEDFREKLKAKSVFAAVGIFLLLLIPAMPNYLPQLLFGTANPKYEILDISPAHRIMLYICVLVPVALYFGLRNQKPETIRCLLIYISLAVLVGFMETYNYTDILSPWSWPFHLCNTALFIIPLCLIFRMKRLFYFTYFINVLGALFAMLMPNYGDHVNVLAMEIYTFWYNHWIAFWMPLLIVALKVFPRAKLRQFIWSMAWFLVYFLIALVFNVVFTAMGHEVDYFFINSNFIADKLGSWADNVFNLTASFNVGPYTFTFHPIYQTIFFFAYVLFGLGVWFVYAEFFRIADAHYELGMKLKTIKQYEYAHSSVPRAEIRRKMMEQNLKASLKLDGFSKKYATSKNYAVKDASFEVEAGEIFGFLGPNGAGKSTIIKSIVGIQQITDGNIEVCGIDVKAHPVECKFNIGYVPDHYALYEKLSGREYINYIADIYEVGEAERNERIEKYLKIFEMQGSIDQQIRTYSHGMKQKVTIMAALVHNPKVWILDEPLTGLDPNSIYQVKECMRAHAAEGNIVFFSSHLIDIVEKLCQRIAIIKHGQIRCVKTVKEIEESGVSLEQFYLDIIGDNSNDPRNEIKDE